MLTHCDTCNVTYDLETPRQCRNCGRLTTPVPEGVFIPCTNCDGDIDVHTARQCPKCQALVLNCPGCGRVFSGWTGCKCPECDALVQEAPLLRCRPCDVQFAGQPGDACPRCGRPVGWGVGGLPWQARRRKRLPMLRAFWRTWKLLSFHPFQAFQSYAPGRPVKEPARYFHLAWWILWAVVALIMWSIGLINWFRWGGAAAAGSWIVEAATMLLAPLVLGLVYLLVARLGIAIHALLVHLAFRLAGRWRCRYVETQSVILYTNGTSMLWFLVPIVGLIAAPIYVLVANTAGLARVHQRSWLLALIIQLVLMAPAIALVIWVQTQ